MSLEALHVSFTEVWVTWMAARPAGFVGGEVSTHALVDALCVALPERLPAAS